MAIGIETAPDRPMRELESIIVGARTTAERVSGVSNRLRDMRVRLLGMNEDQPDAPKVNEVVGSELSDMRLTLQGIDEDIERIEMYISNLESV